MKTVLSVDLYDKDNDHYTTVKRMLNTPEYKLIADYLREELTKLCRKDMLVNRFFKRGVLINEPFDWAIVREIEVEDSLIEEYLTRHSSLWYNILVADNKRR